jgi:hypothetical protein
MPETTPSKKFELMESSSVETLIPKDETPWLWIAIGAALLVALIVWLIRRRMKRAQDPANIREAAFKDAIAALDAISQSDAHAAALESSMILRKYLSVTAEDPALFETHEEFISRHDALQKIPQATRDEVATIFSRLATIKYAPDAANANAEKIVGDSRQLLHALHAALAP